MYIPSPRRKKQGHRNGARHQWVLDLNGPSSGTSLGGLGLATSTPTTRFHHINDPFFAPGKRCRGGASAIVRKLSNAIQHQVNLVFSRTPSQNHAAKGLIMCHQCVLQKENPSKASASRTSRDLLADGVMTSSKMVVAVVCSGNKRKK